MFRDIHLPSHIRTFYRKCDNFYAIAIPILIKPVAIVRVLVVGHTSPSKTPPTIPLHMPQIPYSGLFLRI